MKLRKIPSLSSIPQQTSKLIKPNPPTREAVKRAKFTDKTYHWDSGLRFGNKRVAT